MSAQGSPLSPSPLPAAAPGPSGRSAAARTVAVALVAVAAGGAGCVWAADRASAADRPLVTGAGALAAALLGVAVALGVSRRRLRRELRLRTDALRDEAARTVALHADAARRAVLDLEGAQRAVREAETRRRSSAESETALRTALRAEKAKSAALEGDAARLAETTLPLAVERLRAGGAADSVLARLAQPEEAAHRRLLEALVRELAAGERMRAAGMAACASAASRVQALTTGMLADLREMEQRHDEELLGDLLHLDHCTAQAGRLADSVAVLTGARSGRRWTKPIVMESVLRGAMGRIHAYQRVRLHSTSTLAVAGHAAEGVMHALAELMDNACNFSPPAEQVHVYVQETHSGVVVTIEDAGLVMPDATLARAEKLVSGDPLDVRSLSDNRLGLAVVGCLAHKYGLRVSFRPSSRGGTGVVVLVPSKLVTRGPEDAENGSGDAPDAERYADAGYPRHPVRGQRPDPVGPTGTAGGTGSAGSAAARPVGPVGSTGSTGGARPTGFGGHGGPVARRAPGAPGVPGQTRPAGGTDHPDYPSTGGRGLPRSAAAAAEGRTGTGARELAPRQGAGPAAAPGPWQDRSPAHARPEGTPDPHGAPGTPGAPVTPDAGGAPDGGSPLPATRTPNSPAPSAPSGRPDAGLPWGTGLGMDWVGGAAAPAAPRPSASPLPKRTRGQTLGWPDDGSAGSMGTAVSRPEPTPEQEARTATAGSRFTAFRDAATGGRRIRARAEEPATGSGGSVVDRPATERTAADRTPVETPSADRRPTGPAGAGRTPADDTAGERASVDRTAAEAGPEEPGDRTAPTSLPRTALGGPGGPTP